MQTGLYRLKNVDCFYTLAADGYRTYLPIGDVQTDNVDIRPHDVVLVVGEGFVQCEIFDNPYTSKKAKGFKSPICLWGHWLLAIDPMYLVPVKRENADSPQAS